MMISAACRLSLRQVYQGSSRLFLGRRFSMGGTSSTPTEGNDDNVMIPEDFIENAINSNQITVFSKSYCPYCNRTKQTLARLNNVEIVSYELDKMEYGDELQYALYDMTGQRTVPNVFVGDQHIGGNDDTQEAYQSGRLHNMLGLKRE